MYWPSLSDCRPIGTTFRNNTTIRKFHEFVYFKLTTLANGAFEGGGIAEITFPTSLRNIGTSVNCYCFRNCLNLTSLKFNEGLTTTYDRWCWGSRNITLIDFPSTTTSLQGYSIQPYDANQKNYIIICRAVTPPGLGSNSYTTKLTAVYVPDGSVSAYKTASVWSGISAKIKPLSEYTG